MRRSKLPNALDLVLVSDCDFLSQLVDDVAATLGLAVQQTFDLPDLAENPRRAAMVVVHAKGNHDSSKIIKTVLDGAKCPIPIPVLVITEGSAPEQMIEYIRAGAADCVSSPIEHERLSFLVDSLTIERRLAWQRSNEPVRNGNWVSINGSESVCASSQKLAAVIKQIKKVAPQNTNILMTGETGAGKTRLSRMIHEISPRRDQPFVVVNCAAMPIQLLESELFGHRKGAFTGADKNQEGKFSYVKGGTLLLDEVDTLSLEAQAKLLRTVESRVFEPIGSNESKEFRGRLIVATNQDLSILVQAGKFRADLYYRLNVVDLHVPPLRERPEEIIQIAEACIQEFAATNQTPLRKISPEVRDLLLNHAWPGNIRELRNAIEQAMTFATGDCIRLGDLPKTVLGICRIDPSHHLQQLPRNIPVIKADPVETVPSDGIGATEIRTPSTSKTIKTRELYPSGGEDPPSGDSAQSLDQDDLMMSRASSLRSARAIGEKQILMEVLASCRNNRSEAAKTLGISRTALYKKLSKYGLIGGAMA